MSVVFCLGYGEKLLKKENRIAEKLLNLTEKKDNIKYGMILVPFDRGIKVRVSI